MSYANGPTDAPGLHMPRQGANAAAMAAKLEIPVSLPAIRTQPPLHLHMAALSSQDMRHKYSPSHMHAARLGSGADGGAMSGLSKDSYPMPADVSGMFCAYPMNSPAHRFV
jgi:hypothetical protein